MQSKIGENEWNHLLGDCYCEYDKWVQMNIEI